MLTLAQFTLATMHIPDWMQLILWLVVIGVVCLAITTYAPIHQAFKTLIVVVCIIIAALLILRFFGMI